MNNDNKDNKDNKDNRHHVCGLVESTHFVGSLQGVRVWGTALTAAQRALEMQWPFAIEKPAALDELRLYWRFNNGERYHVVKDLSVALKSGKRVETSLAMVPNDGVLTRPNPHHPHHPHHHHNGGGGSNHMTPADVEEAPCVEDEQVSCPTRSINRGSIFYKSVQRIQGRTV
jgi:hypothetical protein